MAQLTGTAFVVQSKTASQQKWQTENEYVTDNNANPPYTEGEASFDAQAAFDALVATYSGGNREYRVVSCSELRYEVRPV